MKLRRMRWAVEVEHMGERPERKRPLGGSRHRLDVKMDLKCEGSVRSKFIWLRIRISGGSLQTQ
jgi:hypothetical protein